MQKYCDYKPCQFYSQQPTNEQKLKIQKIICPLCVTTIYCSQRCRDLDWTTNHKNNCYKSVPDRSRSCNDHDDTNSSMSSIRRRPEEFEILQINNRTELGKGSYGCVKLVKDKKNGQLFAMKIMNKRNVFEYCTVENLKREIKIQRKLVHPNVTKLFSYFEDKENVYLILEYCENGALYAYIKKRTKLPEHESFVYFFQTCLGIDYLHKNKIIHRDLKPENLLLDKDGNIKICDFGWSAESLAEKRTTFCGTYEYMAPEMLNKQPHDFSLDVWSLGILLFELMHGYAPYRGRTNEELCKKIVAGTPIVFNPSISLDAQNLIRGILKYYPNERFSMKQIFDHPWMKKHSIDYSIDMQTFIYQPTSSLKTGIAPPKVDQMAMRKGMVHSEHKPEPVKPIANNQYQKYHTLEQQNYNSSNNSNNNTNNTSDKLEMMKPRVSRVSNREMMLHQHQLQQQQPEKQLGFIDRVFLAFGCLNREKAPERN